MQRRAPKGRHLDEQRDGEPLCPFVLLRYPGLVARDTHERHLTDEDLERMFDAAVQDEREGRMTHCATEQELQEFLLRLQPPLTP